MTIYAGVKYWGTEFETVAAVEKTLEHTVAYFDVNRAAPAIERIRIIDTIFARQKYKDAKTKDPAAGSLVTGTALREYCNSGNAGGSVGVLPGSTLEPIYQWPGSDLGYKETNTLTSTSKYVKGTKVASATVESIAASTASDPKTNSKASFTWFATQFCVRRYAAGRITRKKFG